MVESAKPGHREPREPGDPDAVGGPGPAASAEGSEPGGRGSRAAAVLQGGAHAVRHRVASLVWLLAVLCALTLAVGALLVALRANEDNTVVRAVLDAAVVLEGPFGRENGIFELGGKDDPRNALVNWGIAAVVYLVAGRVADRVVRP